MKYLLLIILIFSSLTIKSTKIKYKLETKKSYYITIHNYFETKNIPLSSILFVTYCNIYDISPEFALSVGWLESNLGTAKQGRFKTTKSIFGVGEYSHKSLYKFKTYDESVESFCKLIRFKYLVNKSEEELLQNFVNIQGKRYATSLNYETKLKRQYYKYKNLLQY